MQTITFPDLKEANINDIIEKLIQIGEVCEFAAKAFPGAFDAIKRQNQFDAFPDNSKRISKKLLKKKLEVALLEQTERLNKQ